MWFGKLGVGVIISTYSIYRALVVEPIISHEIVYLFFCKRGCSVRISNFLIFVMVSIVVMVVISVVVTSESFAASIAAAVVVV